MNEREKEVFAYQQAEYIKGLEERIQCLEKQVFNMIMYVPMNEEELNRHETHPFKD